MASEISRRRIVGRSSSPFLILILAGTILIAALIFQFAWRLREKPPEIARPKLATMISSSLPSWTEKDEPLGATEQVSAAAERILNSDDYVYRVFRQGEKYFGVYVAYWRSGKMPTRLVASHTPDRCWTENGMRCVVMRFHEKLNANGQPLQPAEYRSFVATGGGAETQVLYWHLVDGKIYDYGERFNAVPSPLLWWRDVVSQAVAGSREQFFVRLTSNERFESLWKDTDFQRIIGELARLGLAEK